ncbi:MAG: serine protease [bacterium]|nr:trypsin-like peptidase domain-containing protein [Myxococcales bacterium]
MRRTPAAALLALTLAACAPADPAPAPGVVATDDAPLIYGADDRREPYQLGDAVSAHLATATAAVFDRSQVVASGAGYALDVATSFGTAYRLCADEPYRNQPSSAFCTGFLVGPDLMATAGHCVDSTSCRDTRFVFGFHMRDASTVTSTVPAGDVYACAAVVTRAETSTDDYAVVRLDRPVAGRAPLAIRRSGTIALGAPVTVAGHPAGIPLKIAGGATVRANSHAYYFGANVDTYGGNSGSPVVASDGTVEGILVRGNTDFVYDSARRCYVSNRCADGGCPGFEGITRVSRFAAAVPVLGEPLCDGAAECDDGDPCTVDSCDPATGCHSATLACGAGASCVAGACVPDPVPACLPRGTACGSNAQCCSNRCSRRSGCR